MDTPSEPRLLRIAEAAELVGLTARAIRYYEELGLLKPAARSDGAYRLYDADDVERLRTIRQLRDDAGFSLAEVGQLLEDEAARARDRARYRASHDPAEQVALTRGAIDGWHPYFFIDASQLGYARTLTNAAALTAAMLVAGLLLIAVTRFARGNAVRR